MRLRVLGLPHGPSRQAAQDANQCLCERQLDWTGAVSRPCCFPGHEDARFAGTLLLEANPLGRAGDPAVQEKALAGNTIFFAQPTADVPSMELPPPPDALVDSLNVIFARNLHDLSKAEWAIVNRDEYLKIVRERKQHCPVFADVSICKDDLASSRLPEHGVPEHITACALEVDGSENALVKLEGPASRIADAGRQQEAGDESEVESDTAEAGSTLDGVAPQHLADGDAAQVPAAASDGSLDVPELSIAVDPVHDVKPVKMMQALRANIEALQSHAASILRNERTARVQSKDGSVWTV